MPEELDNNTQTRVDISTISVKLTSLEDKIDKLSEVLVLIARTDERVNSAHEEMDALKEAYRELKTRTEADIRDLEIQNKNQQEIIDDSARSLKIISRGAIILVSLAIGIVTNYFGIILPGFL